MKKVNRKFMVAMVCAMGIAGTMGGFAGAEELSLSNTAMESGMSMPAGQGQPQMLMGGPGAMGNMGFAPSMEAGNLGSGTGDDLPTLPAENAMGNTMGNAMGNTGEGSGENQMQQPQGFPFMPQGGQMNGQLPTEQNQEGIQNQEGVQNQNQNQEGVQNQNQNQEGVQNQNQNQEGVQNLEGTQNQGQELRLDPNQFFAPQSGQASGMPMGGGFPMGENQGVNFQQNDQNQGFMQEQNQGYMPEQNGQNQGFMQEQNQGYMPEQNGQPSSPSDVMIIFPQEQGQNQMNPNQNQGMGQGQVPFQNQMPGGENTQQENTEQENTEKEDASGEETDTEGQDMGNGMIIYPRGGMPMNGGNGSAQQGMRNQAPFMQGQMPGTQAPAPQASTGENADGNTNQEADTENETSDDDGVVVIG